MGGTRGITAGHLGQCSDTEWGDRHEGGGTSHVRNPEGNHRGSLRGRRHLGSVTVHPRAVSLGVPCGNPALSGIFPPDGARGTPPNLPPSPAADPAHSAALPRHLSPHGATPRGYFTWGGGLCRGKMGAKSLPWAPMWLQQDLGFPQCHLQWDNWEPAKDPQAPMDGLRRRCLSIDVNSIPSTNCICRTGPSWV